MARSGWSAFLPTLFTLISIVLAIIVLAAGVHNQLSQIYYLKVETKGLSAPSKLSNSTFLADLSTVSGTDFVGANTTAQTLGLADSYTITLLTSCAHFDGISGVLCLSPSLGFSFNPATDLRLESTSLQESFSKELLDALSNYSKVSRFLALGYVVGVVLLALGTMSDWFSHRSLAAGIFASFFGLISTILFFAASVTAVVVFKKVSDSYNDSLNSHGLSSSLGYIPVGLGFAAFLFALFSTSAFAVHAKGSSSSGQGRRGYRNAGGMSRGLVTGADPLEAEPLSGPRGPAQKPGLWGRMPTWNRHTYVQVEKQGALGRNDLHAQRAVVVDSEHDVPEEAVRRRLDNDWAAHDDYSHAPSHGPDSQSSIPMLTLGSNNRSLDQDTAYEPFKSKATP
ncbi:hypothetical protein GQ53DRAFT_212656 [Thozetella sp. PMI_491]|nr:hypothetical protein GQ53DRAFT_212656 [Thozetella sp. PMI_491]